jgi:hypothetical protein
MKKSVFLVILFGLLMIFRPAGPVMAEAPSYFSQINADNIDFSSIINPVTVAILDSGVDIKHPDLLNNLWRNTDEIAGDGLDNDNNGYIDDINGWDFAAATADPSPKKDPGYSEEGLSHGTAIAGFIASQTTDYGIRGLAPNAKIMSLRVLSGTGEGDVENVIKAIKYAVNNGAEIINLSFVGYDASDNLKNVIKWAYDRGVVVVAAAGNGLDNSNEGINLDQKPAYPVCYGGQHENKNLLAVAALTSDNQKSDFSNFGGNCVNISAPGERLLGLVSILNEDGYQQATEKASIQYAYWSGTSFSAGLISGAAALLKAKNKNLTAAEIIRKLVTNSKNIDGVNQLYIGKIGGLVDVQTALSNTAATVGQLIKTKDFPAVYYVDEIGWRHLFTSDKVYWTWFSGSWATQKIRIVSQEEFESYGSSENIIARAGSLIQFDNSNSLWVVTTGNKICRLQSPAAAERLYGSAWQDRLTRITAAFEIDYTRDDNCLIDENADYPDGSLISYFSSTDIYYLDGGQKYLLTVEGLAANNFKTSLVVKNVPESFAYPTGAIIYDWQKQFFPYKY